MSPIRTLCATTSLFLLALATACTPQSPTERVAEMRSRFTVEVNPGGFVAEPNMPAPAPMAEEGMEGEGTDAMPADGADGSMTDDEKTMDEMGGDGTDMGAMEPESYDIVLDLLIKNGNSDVLPQLTVDLIHADSAQKEKERWPVTFDTSHLLSGDSSQFSHRLTGVDYVEGDSFTAEVRSGITPEEYGNYPEFNTAQ